MNNKRRRQRDRGKRKALRKIIRQKPRGSKLRWFQPGDDRHMVIIGTQFTREQEIQIDDAQRKLAALYRGLPTRTRDEGSFTVEFKVDEINKDALEALFGKGSQ